MLFEHENYRTYLKTELADRVAANGAYSLRAFAQKLGVSSGFLSEVLQGKKTLSTDAALKVATKLDLTESETHYFCLLVQLESSSDPVYRDAIEKKLKTMNPRRVTTDLSIEVFRAISDWYHFAILELTRLSQFELTAQSAAAHIGISKAESDAAIDRLIRLELLERDKSGILRKTKNYLLAQSQVPNSALKSYHKQLLEKASTALIHQTPRERVSSSDIVPIDSRYVEEVRQLSDGFTSDLLKISEKSKRKDHVYCLSVHFFKLSSERKT